MSRRLTWMVLILLVAAFLRLHDLPHIPPGMTHDEADHGLDAWRVVQGARPLYFTVGYGREPLYDYSTAILMSFMGPSFLAGRLTSVFFSLILLAASYAWTRRALGGSVALLAAAGLALGFWPLMTSRQSLRSETLPALLAVAMVFFWEAMRRERRQSLVSFLVAGLFLGLTFYTYIPSRILWLIFPGLAFFYVLVGQRAPWRGTIVTLSVSVVIGLPLFAYLSANPGAEARIDQLARPLQQAAQGEFAPLWVNVKSGLSIFTIAGDDQWRYNIADRPLLGPVAGVLFYIGLIYAAWRVLTCVWVGRQATGASSTDCSRAAGLFVALLWLELGLAPVLATGRSLSATQAIGLQAVLYIFPALTLAVAARRLEPWLLRRLAAREARLLLSCAALLLGLTLLATTWRAYFQTWANHPDVAIQYEADLVAIVRRLNDLVAGGAFAMDGEAAISTDAPGRFHDAATAQMFLEDEQFELSWFDGRHSLLFPALDAPYLVFSAAAPLNPALAPYLEALGAVTVPEGPGETTYQITHSPTRLLQFYPQFSTEINSLSTELSTEIIFGDVVQFIAYEIQTPDVTLGEALQVATAWRVQGTHSTDLVLFTHLLDAAGSPVSQADRLDAPTHAWRAGDVFIQLHTLPLPEALPPGTYELATGLYDAVDWRERLPVAIDGAPEGDLLLLTTLVIGP